MKTRVAAALAALAVAVAAPAFAQPPYWDIGRREHWIGERLERGVADRSVERREARRVRRQLDEIRAEESRMRQGHGGRLTEADRRALETRLDVLNDHIRWVRRNEAVPPWRR